jgi:amidophosphoribosyltransferase
MANLETLVAFNAALALLKENGKYDLVEEVYHRCKAQEDLADKDVKNFVNEIYDQFTTEQISAKISELLTDESVNAKVEIIFQPVANLHKAIPDHLGDWYFTGNYPTVGGNRVVNRAFINFYEGNKERAY